MKKNVNRLLALLMALAMALALTACGQKEQTPAAEADAPAVTEQAADTQGEKHITLTVTYPDETSDSYEIDTSAEFLKDAIADTVELGGSDGEYGFYLESVNGVTADYATDGAYWAIFVNDEYGMFGLDSQPVTDGDSYALVYTVG